jgi:hypothetical protein
MILSIQASPIIVRALGHSHGYALCLGILAIYMILSKTSRRSDNVHRSFSPNFMVFETSTLYP